MYYQLMKFDASISYEIVFKENLLLPSEQIYPIRIMLYLLI